MEVEDLHGFTQNYNIVAAFIPKHIVSNNDHWSVRKVSSQNDVYYV